MEKGLLRREIWGSVGLWEIDVKVSTGVSLGFGSVWCEPQ